MKSTKWYCNPFFLMNISLSLAILISFIFSIFDKKFCIIAWSNNINDVIGVVTQVVTTMSTLVVSVIGISISLQNDEFFGVKVSKLYALRIENYYSILETILISIFLCTINILCYIFNLVLASLVVSAVSIFFSIFVSITEIPIMSKDEKAIIRILKDNVKYNFLWNREATPELKMAIKYIICDKNLKYVYNELKTNSDSYNCNLILKLLEYQQDIAFQLNHITNSGDLYKATGSLLENVFYVLLNNLELSQTTYNKVMENKHLLTRVLFRLEKIQIIRNDVLNKISGLCRLLNFSNSIDREKAKFLSSIVVILTASTIKKGNFNIAKALQKEYSSLYFRTKETNYACCIFLIISMQLYYLCYSEQSVPKDLKDKIQNYIQEESFVDKDNFKIEAWGTLFDSIIECFNIDFKNFIELCLLTSDSLEFWIYDNKAHFVFFDTRYFVKWYLTQLFCSDKMYNYDYSALYIDSSEIKYGIKNFGDNCLDENGDFFITEEMNSMANFSKNKTNRLKRFEIIEKNNKNFFNFVNNIRREDIKDDISNSKNVDIKRLESIIRQKIDNAIKQEWGYDSSVECKNTERGFSTIIELFSDNNNLEEFISNYCIDNIFADIATSTQKTKIFYNKDLEISIKNILNKNIKYVTQNLKSAIPYFYIQNEDLRQHYFDKANAFEGFDSNILGVDAIVTNNGFRFNCIVEKCEIRYLSEEEISNQIKKHQRTDGQYVFEGTFLPKEEIIKIIGKKFIIFTLIVRYKVESTKETIFELYPYSEAEDM